MKKNGVLTIGIMVCLMEFAAVAQTAVIPETQKSRQPVLLLISRPTDIGTDKDQKKSLWLSALLDAAAHFRFDALTSLRTVDGYDVGRYVPSAFEAGAAIDYSTAIRDLKPTHILNQKFTFSDKNKSLSWHLQTIDLTSGSVVSTFETEMPFDYLPHTADSLFRKTAVRLAGKKLTREESRFFGAQAFCLDPKNNRLFGELLLDDCYNSRTPPRLMGEKYAELLKTERQPLMVMWYCGLASARDGNTDRAQEMYRVLYRVLPDNDRCGLAIAQLHIIKDDAQTAKYHLSSMVSENKKPLREAYATLGDVYLLGKDSAAALAYYEKERDLYGAGPALRGKIAPLYFAKGQFSRARTEYELVVKADSTNAEANFALAVIALKAGRLTEADAYLAASPVPKKGAPELWEELGDAYLSAGLKPQAIRAYEKLVALDKKSSYGLRKLADAWLSARNDAAAADWYVRLFDLDPKLYEPLLLKAAGLYTKAKAFDKAADSYERYFKEGFTSFDATTAYARILYAREDWKKVIDLLKPFAGSPAAKKEILLMLANAYCQTEGYKEAVPVLITLHAMDPADPKILELSAIASEQTGNLAKAALLYEAYLKYKKDKTAAGYAYHAGEIYEKLGRTPDAIARYEKNCTTFPRDLRNYKRLSELYQASGDWTKLKRTVETAMNRMAVPSAMTKALAQACAALGERQRAAYLYQSYLNREPKDEEAWLGLGTALFEQKKYKRAIKPLAHAAKKYPKDFKCHSMLGFARLRLGNYSDALDALEKARDISPRDITTLERTAKCQRALKQRNQLIATLKEWAELERGRYDIRVETAGLLLARKDYDEAAKYAKAALKIKPGDPTARRILFRATRKRT